MTTYAMSAMELADHLDITPRRVTQYRDEGKLPTIERGRFDLAWLLNLRLGERVTKHVHRKPPRDVLVALGWLTGITGDPRDDDVNAFVALFERNGLTAGAAHLALGRAMGRR